MLAKLSRGPLAKLSRGPLAKVSRGPLAKLSHVARAAQLAVLACDSLRMSGIRRRLGLEKRCVRFTVFWVGLHC